MESNDSTGNDTETKQQSHSDNRKSSGQSQLMARSNSECTISSIGTTVPHRAETDVVRLMVISTPSTESKTSAFIKSVARQRDADTNIDRHYRQLMAFHQTAIDQLIPQLKQEYQELRNKLNRSPNDQTHRSRCDQELNPVRDGSCSARNGVQNDTTATQLDGRTAIIARMREIRDEITKIKYDHKQYMASSARSVFCYYENKQDISSGTNRTSQASVLRFLNLVPDTSDAESNNDPKTSDTRRLIQKYWMNTEGKIVHTDDFHVDTLICMSCHKGEMIPQDDEGTLVCNHAQCGKYISHIVDNQKTSHTEVPAEICYTAYIRLNHFKEILSQFQAKQSTVIPQHIIDSIAVRMKKERLTKDDICYSQMRNTLTILGLSKYFEHIQHINAIFGVKPPVMDAELYDTMCVLFIEIQEPWAVCCPPDRRNFFNYTYVLYQLFYLLGQKQFWKYTSVAADRVMKDRVKQMEQDNTWKNVCKILDWAYNPTV
jgi:hypothetical protein